MIATFARVLVGFVLACITAGLIQVLFITPPQELFQIPARAFPERSEQVGVLALLAATHAAIFSAAFSLIAAGVGEWMRIRSVTYYLATGATIAALGFSAQYASEVAGQPTIFNPYALTAFITSGVFAGFIYWLISGRRAGGSEADAEFGSTSESQAAAVAPAVRTWKSRPRIIVDDPIAPGSKAAKKASLADRLAEREEKSGEPRTVSQQTADAAVAAIAKTATNTVGQVETKLDTKSQDSRPTAQAAVTSVPATKSVPASSTHGASGNAAKTSKAD